MTVMLREHIVQTEQELVEFLADRAASRWENGLPYFLSLIATDLKERDLDYRPIIGEERLKSFVKRVASDGGFKIIEHPTQRAKVAIVPKEADFEFEDANPVPLPPKSIDDKSFNDAATLLAFFRSLSRLPDSALDAIHIPTKVIVRLLTRR